MAGEFVIEALEPRQLLSSNPVATPLPATTATATATVTITACATTSSTISSATGSTSASTTDTTKNPAFVRPGSTASTISTSTGSTSDQGSPIPWGTDIYPPPVFTGTSGHGTSRTTVLVGPAAPTSATASGTSTASTTTIPPGTILIGRRLGKSGAAKHFTIRPSDEVVHSGRPSGSGGVIGPQIVSPPTAHPSQFAPTTFAEVSRSSVRPASSSIGTFSTTEYAIHGLSLANWTATVGPAGNASIGSPRPLPASMVSGHISPALPESQPSPSAGARLMRPVAANGLAGLLLPLATMDTAVISTGGTPVRKWEVDVALGSLSVVVAGYWYLCDAAERRRRQRAQAVSLFCGKPVE